jgi:hypothetical protein
MSSLAATKSDGFYFPPEWRPEFGGLSKYQGSKGANQYQTDGVIRFELPFDAWCMKCERHISKGLRFNAKKEKAPEKYFTTQIWKFTMKCPCPTCDQRFVIKTDPENDTYDMAEGMRKMEQDFEPELNDSIIKATTDEERNLLSIDPMFRLQHEKEDKRRAQSAKEHIESLIDLQDSQKEKDYDMNSLLRKGNRDQRKRAIFLLEEGQKRGLNIPLVEENDVDYTTSDSLRFLSRSNLFTVAERSKMSAIQSQSIFPSSLNSIKGSDPDSKRQHKGGEKIKAGAKNTSSELRKQQKICAAIRKQAVVNIDTKKLRISHSNSSSSDISLLNIQNSQRIKSTSNLAREVVTPISPVFEMNALNMVSTYSDDVDD